MWRLAAKGILSRYLIAVWHVLLHQSMLILSAWISHSTLLLFCVVESRNMNSQNAHHVHLCRSNEAPGQADSISCGIYVLAAALLEALGGEVTALSFGQEHVDAFRKMFWQAITTGHLAWPTPTTCPLPAAFGCLEMPKNLARRVSPISRPADITGTFSSHQHVHPVQTSIENEWSAPCRCTGEALSAKESELMIS